MVKTHTSVKWVCGAQVRTHQVEKLLRPIGRRGKIKDTSGRKTHQAERYIQPRGRPNTSQDITRRIQHPVEGMAGQIRKQHSRRAHPTEGSAQRNSGHYMVKNHIRPAGQRGTIQGVTRGKQHSTDGSAEHQPRRKTLGNSTRPRCPLDSGHDITQSESAFGRGGGGT